MCRSKFSHKNSEELFCGSINRATRKIKAVPETTKTPFKKRRKYAAVEEIQESLCDIQIMLQTAMVCVMTRVTVQDLLVKCIIAVYNMIHIPRRLSWISSTVLVFSLLFERSFEFTSFLSLSCFFSFYSFFLGHSFLSYTFPASLT